MAPFPSFFVFLLCIILGWNQVVGQQFYNVTVDDTDLSMSYIGGWQQSTYTELDHGGRHMIAVDPEAYVEFMFHGTAIYFLSPLWPFNLTTQVQLDSGPPTIVSLRDVNAPERLGGAETAASRVVWSANNLDDRELHRLNITVAPGDRFAIVDGFIVTAVDYQKNETLTTSTKTEATPISYQINATSTTATATTATTAAAAATDSPTSRESRAGKLTVPIGVGIGLGALAFLVASVVVLYKFCRRRRTETSRGTPQLDLEKSPPPSSTFIFTPTPGCATPSEPTPHGFEIRVAGDPSLSSPIRTALEGLSTSSPKYGTLLSPTKPPPTHTIEPALRRVTFNRPPPAYHECVDSDCRDN